MKQHFLSLATVLFSGIAMLTSCNTKSEYEEHQISLQTRYNTVNTILYGDQITDTVWVKSTENWTATLEKKTTNSDKDNNAAPLTITPQSVKVKQGYYAITPIVIAAAKPSTDSIPQHYLLQIKPTQGKLNSLTHHVIQTNWLHINGINNIEDFNKPHLAEQFEYEARTIYFAFTLYNPQLSTHALTSDADWLTVPAEAKQPKTGYQVVELKATENPTNKPRVAHVSLSSGGVTTTITFTQKGRP